MPKRSRLTTSAKGIEDPAFSKGRRSVQNAVDDDEESIGMGEDDNGTLTDSDAKGGGRSDSEGDESQDDEPDDGKLADDADPLQVEINEGLTELKSITGKWKTESYAKKVVDVLSWLKADTKISNKLKIPRKYYQRNPGEGWSEKQKGLYVATVFAGKAKTPFVVNIIRSEARVMDGGHRIEAIRDFIASKVGLVVNASGTKVFFKDMHHADSKHFMDQKLQFLEYSDLPLHDEIAEYLNLNSGLPFTIGEKLAAMKQINYCVQVASKINKQNQELVSKYLPILTPDIKAARMNDLLVATFLAYNLWYRNESGRHPSSSQPSAMAMALRAEFCNTISASNFKDYTMKPRSDYVLEGIAHVTTRAEAAMQLFQTITGPGGAAAAKERTGQTPYRRMLICMLAVTEIPTLDHGVFKRFVESRVSPVKELRMLRDKSYIEPPAIGRFCEAYDAFAAN